MQLVEGAVGGEDGVARGDFFVRIGRVHVVMGGVSVLVDGEGVGQGRADHGSCDVEGEVAAACSVCGGGGGLEFEFVDEGA